MVYHGIIPGLFTAKDTPLDQIGGYVHRYASFLGDGWIHLRSRSQQRADLQFAAATSARAQAHDRL